MSVYSSLTSVKEELSKCMRCGNCQAVCPIYKETRREVGVARGKISLVETILSGQMELTMGMAERFSLCTTCMACNANCPCGVRFDRIILAARAEAVRKQGLNPVKKLAFSTLRLLRLFAVGMRTGSILQGVAFKKVAGRPKEGRLRFDLGLGSDKIFPHLSRRTLKAEFPEISRVPNPKMKVGFFTGCVINYFYTDIGKAVITVLKANDIEVVIPRSQGCCGIPASVNGDVSSAQKMAKNNLHAFEQAGVDALVVACSSCGSAWKHTFAELLEGDLEAKTLAEKWAANSWDIAEFLVCKVPFKKDDLGRVEKKVTYHDPCHLNRGQGITKEPREILKAIPGLELIEMKEPGRCCGMAGSFSLTHPGLSEQILNHKILDIAQTKTDAVVTGCPACRLQLNSGIQNAGLGKEVVHTIQLLAESYERTINK